MTSSSRRRCAPVLVAASVALLVAVLPGKPAVGAPQAPSLTRGAGLAGARFIHGFDGFNFIRPTTLTGTFAEGSQVVIGTLTIDGFACDVGGVKGGQCGYQPSLAASGHTLAGAAMTGVCTAIYTPAPPLGGPEGLLFTCQLTTSGVPFSAVIHVLFFTPLGDPLSMFGDCVPFTAQCFDQGPGPPYDGVYIDS